MTGQKLGITNFGVPVRNRGLTMRAMRLAMRARGLTLRALKFIAKNAHMGSPIAQTNVARIMLVTYTLTSRSLLSPRKREERLLTRDSLREETTCKRPLASLLSRDSSRKETPCERLLARETPRQRLFAKETARETPGERLLAST